MQKTIIVHWEEGAVQGAVGIAGGSLLAARFVRGGGSIVGDDFNGEGAHGVSLQLEIEGKTAPGAGASIVSLKTAANPFSFFLRDVDAAYPILIPEYGVAVTTTDDGRSYGELRDGVSARMRESRTLYEREPSFEEAAAVVKDKQLGTWLGIGRDIRLFGVGFAEYDAQSYDWIEPRLHERKVSLPESADVPVRYHFRFGRGDGGRRATSRRLADGKLPILHGEVDDGDMLYRTTAFATLERSPLTAAHVRGTHHWTAAGHTSGITFTSAQQAAYDALHERELERDEETVLCYRIEAANRAAAPRYAWFKAPVPNGTWVPSVLPSGMRCVYDGARGFGVYEETGRVGFIALLDGKPVPQEEIAVLVPPGGALVYDIIVPHRPISQARAARLSERDPGELLEACRAYWQAKLDAAARFNLPEARIGEMVQAGLLHLDLILYGIEPDGPVTPTIGVYPPIGSESAPIIQFLDSMGLHGLAERCLAYFLDKQQEDGGIFNFLHYMIETGCVLWSLGEHYRYTRDDGWVASIKDGMLRSCRYMIEWRSRNLSGDGRVAGYGMLDGKVADPEDEGPVRVFMLNAYAYLGLSRAAEMLASTDPAQAETLRAEAAALRGDIRRAYEDAMARGPVIPLGDGTWCPTVSPWAGGHGPAVLFAEPGEWYSHGAVGIRDSLCGPLYLVFGEIVDPDEPGAAFMLNAHRELLCLDNVAYTQPYYSRHPRIHLQRGEVRPFLQAYYYTMASMADRETYTFAEHLNPRISEHKTHEEAWFLMETRWMLYMEAGDTLQLLKGVPRRWLADGPIVVSGAASYFGALTFKAELGADILRVSLACEGRRGPANVEIRTPHPDYRRPVHVEGGVYDEASESVRIAGFGGRAVIELRF
ncbi:hypothetical protein ACFSR7_31465 [Cohnella sp. GCM10020058]|uniref:hypothetical protein n=1 Tax=Cohnella sp. GCM10020058 TaxID=3317330 RepID=UPI003645C83D